MLLPLLRAGRISIARRKMFTVAPRISLFDAPLRISAEQLRPFESVQLRNQVHYKDTVFSSVADFKADADGRLDCETHPAISGSYIGVDAMGLFWSLSSPVEKRDVVFMPRNAEELEFTLSLKAEERKEEVRIRRIFLHPDVERIEVNHGRLRGVLFLPKGVKSRIPGIVDIYGTGGGLLLSRAALLASHGFAVLALAVFSYRDQPKDLSNVHLEYFMEGLDWLESRPEVGRLGMIGASFGAVISMLTSVHYNKVKAVVSINGFHMLDSLTPLFHRGQPLPTVKGDESLVKPSEHDSRLHYRDYRSSILLEPSRVFPLEKAEADFRFFVGGDDQCSPTEISYQELTNRLKMHGKRNWSGEVFPGAGHLLEPPYLPLVQESWHKVLGHRMAWGGEKGLHNQAQVKMWSQTLEFFRDKLGQPHQMRPLID